jgi:hypothetical protein
LESLRTPRSSLAFAISPRPSDIDAATVIRIRRLGSHEISLAGKTVFLEVTNLISEATMSNEAMESEWKSKVTRMGASLEKAITPSNTTILFWTAFVLFLLFQSYAPTDIAKSTLVSSLVKALVKSFIGLWVYADGRARGFNNKWHRWYWGFSLLFPEIAVPMYIFHSRGRMGAAKSTFRFVGYLLLASVIWVGVVGVLHIFGIHEAGTSSFTF